MSSKKLRVAVLVSGRGSNMEALAEAARSGKINAELVLVLSDKDEAPALSIAQKFDVPAVAVPYDKQKYSSRETYFAALAQTIDAYNPDLIVLAGFMKVLRKEFIARYADRLINIHPSLLPAFPGLNVQQAALDARVPYSGCTVHVVTEDVDSGPVIGQVAVPVLADDDAETLAARILVEEHKLLPLVVDLIANGKVRISAEKAGVSVQIDKDCVSLLSAEIGADHKSTESN